MERPYYSQRTGKGVQPANLDLNDLKGYFTPFFQDFEREGYFQEYLGYECVDNGFVSGLAGSDLNMEMLVTLRKKHLWPIVETLLTWTEDDFFDVVEFLYDRVSKPTERRFHDYNNCGWHCSEFDRTAGRVEYRARINRALNAYDTGFELSEQGEVFALADTGLEPLLTAKIPASAPDNVRVPMQTAIKKFRRHRASSDERLDAIRDLASALEFIRPQVKTFFDKDEGDMFNLANNFAIRHNNGKQKEKYDTEIWYSWMFNYYLATLHATLRMVDNQTPA